jgi:hypothetical protein
MQIVFGWEMARLPQIYGVAKSLTDACLQAHLEQGRRCGSFKIFRIEVSDFAWVSWMFRADYRITYRHGWLREGLVSAPFVFLRADTVYRIAEIGEADFVERRCDAIRYSLKVDGYFGTFVTERSMPSVKLVA